MLMKVETHNHPTAISPFPGASTGAGGEIRDEGATGRGSRPKAGVTGFVVSNLHLPALADAPGSAAAEPEPWERERYGRPGHIASALQIMIDGPAGRRRVQQRVRPAQPGRLLPRLRADRRRRAARLPQADHDRRRPRRDRRERRRTRSTSRPARCWSSSAGRACASAWAAARRARWPPAPTPPSSTSTRSSAATRRSSAAPRRSSTTAARSAPTTRSWRSTTSAPAASRTRSPSWSTAPGAAHASTCAACRSRKAVWRRRRSGATRARSATSWRSRRKRCRGSPRCASASAARTRSSAWRPRRASSSSARSTRRGRPTPGTTRRSSTCRWRCCSASRRGCIAMCARRAVALPALDLAGVELAGVAFDRPAPPDRRQQALPGHDRRPHRRRPVQPRPDGRPVAGAGRRLRGHARRFQRLSRRGDGAGRAYPAGRPRRAGVGPDGGRRGDHQPARRADRAGARQAELQLDGGMQRRTGRAWR